MSDTYKLNRAGLAHTDRAPWFVVGLSGSAAQRRKMVRKFARKGWLRHGRHHGTGWAMLEYKEANHEPR